MVRVYARQWHECVMWMNVKHRRATTTCEANEGIIELAVSEGEVKQVGSGCLRRSFSWPLMLCLYLDFPETCLDSITRQ